MAVFPPPMPARKRREAPIEDGRERLQARIAELEQRLQLLEARVRRVAVTSEEKGDKSDGRTPRPRPRCPGCRLELPKGRRGECCVWCGFYFEAAPRRAMKG